MPFNVTILKDSSNPEQEFIQEPSSFVIEDVDGIAYAYMALQHSHNVASFLVNDGFDSSGQFIVIRNGDTLERPTSLVLNGSCDFIIRNAETDAMARAKLIICTEEGSLYGFSPLTGIDSAIFQLNVEGANFTGIAINNKESLIYVCDYAHNVVRTFNGQWEEVTADYPFADPDLPNDYGCFGIINTEGSLFVCYNSGTHTPLSGYVNQFDYNGNFIKRFITDVGLDGSFSMCFPPPECWGRHKCLFHVANNGSGLISTYSKKHGKFNSYLKNMNQDKLMIEGLRCIVPWGKYLYYTASANGGVSGQIGSIKYI